MVQIHEEKPIDTSMKKNAYKVFSFRKFFLHAAKFWRENFPVALKTNKRDSATFYQGLTKNKPLMTWPNPFHDDFNQKSRRINKKKHEVVGKNKL